MKSITKVVFVIIATFVGAGFASGKEIYSFFLVYGAEGIVGICISAFLISLVVYKVFKICEENDIKEYKEFCEYIVCKNVIFRRLELRYKISVWIRNAVNILLLLTFFIMVSGFSSFLKQEFNISKILGGVAIVVLCYVTFQKNIEGLMRISNYLIPVMIIFLFLVSAKNLDIQNNYYKVSMIFLNENRGMAIVKAVLYGSYNCILLIPVLITLRRWIKGGIGNVIVSVATFILIIVLSLAIYNILLLGDVQVFSLEMPIIEIVKRYGIMYQYGYVIMVGISIYTTAISTGCGFLNGVSKGKHLFKRNSFLICVLAFFLSQISFSVLVSLVYPVLGIVGIAEMILIYQKAKGI